MIYFYHLLYRNKPETTLYLIWTLNKTSFQKLFVNFSRLTLTLITHKIFCCCCCSNLSMFSCETWKHESKEEYTKNVKLWKIVKDSLFCRTCKYRFFFFGYLWSSFECDLCSHKIFVIKGNIMNNKTILT